MYQNAEEDPTYQINMLAFFQAAFSHMKSKVKGNMGTKLKNATIRFCFAWRELMNIHVAHDVLLMNIYVTR